MQVQISGGNPAQGPQINDTVELSYGTPHRHLLPHHLNMPLGTTIVTSHAIRVLADGPVSIVVRSEGNYGSELE